MRKVGFMRIMLAVCVLAGIAQGVLARGAKETGTNRDSLVVSVGAGITSGDYEPWGWDYGYEDILLFHSSLLHINNNVEVEPDLATAYTVSADSLVYTFDLRRDIKFSDGSAFTADDVVFTFETAKNAGGAIDLTMMKSVEAVGPYQARFTLNKVFSPFIRTAAMLGIVPKASYGPDYSKNPIGTGPWKLKQIDPGQQLIIEPNPYYYGTKPAFKQVTLLAIGEETALAAARSGQIDVVMVNPEYAKEKISGFHIENIKTSDNRGFNLPTIPETRNSRGELVGNNVTSDPVVRRALNIGVNRRDIINNALNGIGTPSWVRFEGLPWASEEPGLRDGQVEEAKRLLDEAGWIAGADGVRVKNGVRAEFRITGRSDDLQRYNLAVALAEDAKKLGIRINAESVDWSTAKAIARNVPTCIGTGSYSYYDVYVAFSSAFAGIETVDLSNSGMYTNAATDRSLAAMLDSKSDEEAISWARRAQYENGTGPNVDFPYIWLVNIDHCYFVRDGLNLGVQRIHPHGHGMPVIQNMNEWRYN